MIKKYRTWYNNLTPLKQFAVSLILNWFYWLTAWLILERFFFDKQRSWSYHIFHATWMSFFMTIFLEWKTTKALFKTDSAPKIINDSDKP